MSSVRYSPPPPPDFKQIWIWSTRFSKNPSNNPSRKSVHWGPTCSMRMTKHDEALIIKPTRCTNFSNLFLEWNSTCFGQFLYPSSGVFTVHTAVVYVVQVCWHMPLLCVQWKTSDDRQRNCPKHVEFHSKNKFEKLVHLVGFIIRDLTRCTVTWTSNDEADSPFLKILLTSLIVVC